MERSLTAAIAGLIVESASLVPAQTIETLCSFNGAPGVYPEATLTLGLDGNFYGTTSTPGSGATNYGTVFQVTTDGWITTVVSFIGANGAGPNGLTLGPDGNLYGTTGADGSGGAGTVFQTTTNGALTTLASFNGADGWGPEAPLALGPDGSFYGTTEGFGEDISTNVDGLHGQ